MLAETAQLGLENVLLRWFTHMGTKLLAHFIWAYLWGHLSPLIAGVQEQVSKETEHGRYQFCKV